MMKTFIARTKYLEKIAPYRDTDLIKVLVGQRRVGKSYILLQIIEDIKNTGVSESDIIYINKEDIAWRHIRDFSELYDVIKDYKYIFIDEIQDIQDWEKALRSLQSEGTHDIYITGSNSHLLGGELASYLSGRYISFDIYPLSFPEFLEFHNLERSRDTFFQYMMYGGLPYLKHLSLTDEIVFGYLKDVVNTIVLKDVVTRHRIRNIDFYKQLISYLAKEVGTIFSAKNMSDYLKSQKVAISTNVVLDYLSYSKSALFLHEVPRYDIRGKKRFEVRQKYFYTDIGIRNILAGGYSSLDIGGILENIVYIHLISQGWKVEIGEIDKREIDFIAQKKGEIIYVQVAYVLESQKTIEREFSVYQQLSDNWKKYVVTLDTLPGGVRDGVYHKNIIDFICDDI